MQRSARRRELHSTPIAIQITPAQSPERTVDPQYRSHNGRSQSSEKGHKSKPGHVGIRHRTDSSNHLCVNTLGSSNHGSRNATRDDNPSYHVTQSDNDDDDESHSDSLDVPRPRKSSLRTRSLGDIFDGVPLHVRFKLTSDNSEADESVTLSRRCRSISPFTGIRKGGIPTGSDSFRQIMYEMQSESEASKTDSTSSADEGNNDNGEGSAKDKTDNSRSKRRRSLRQRTMTRNALRHLTQTAVDD